MRRRTRLWGVLGLLVGLALAPAAWAVLSNNPVFPQQPILALGQFLAGTDAPLTYKTLYTPTSPHGAKCFSLVLTTTDTTAQHLVTVQITSGGVDYGGMVVTTQLGSGFVEGLPPQHLLAATLWPGLATDSDGNRWLFLGTGHSLRATYATALTAGKAINLQLSCVEF